MSFTQAGDKGKCLTSSQMEAHDSSRNSTINRNSNDSKRAYLGYGDLVVVFDLGHVVVVLELFQKFLFL